MADLRPFPARIALPPQDASEQNGRDKGEKEEGVADARYRNVERTKLLSSRVLAFLFHAFAACHARTPLIIELLQNERNCCGPDGSVHSQSSSLGKGN